jgi:ABC-type phosphate transport system substrate-binding protein
MKINKTLAFAGLLSAAAAVGAAPRAYAQGGTPLCTDLPNSDKQIFMGGTTAVIPVIRLMGARLKQVGVTLLWNENSEGCGSVFALTNPSGGSVRTTYTQYDEDPLQPGKVTLSNCLSKLNQSTDLIINDVSVASCSSGILSATLPSGYAEFSGPVQGLVPIVPLGNTFLNEITVDELQQLYRCGAKGAKAPFQGFSDDSTIYDYNCTGSGMRQLWARGIGASNGDALSSLIGLGCNSILTAESMVQKVSSSLGLFSTIGYTSTEYYDLYRTSVKGLKVQGVNQVKAYLPDTDITSVDKINIREGRYTIQNTLKLVTAVDSNGVPSIPLVKKLIDWFQDNPGQEKLPFDVNEIYASRGVVPLCAMRVTKTSDYPVFKRYKHPTPCHCDFEKLATGKTGCVPCGDAGVDSGVDGGATGTCPTGSMCSHGFCEQI